MANIQTETPEAEAARKQGFLQKATAVLSPSQAERLIVAVETIGLALKRISERMF